MARTKGWHLQVPGAIQYPITQMQSSVAVLRLALPRPCLQCDGDMHRRLPRLPLPAVQERAAVQGPGALSGCRVQCRGRAGRLQCAHSNKCQANPASLYTVLCGTLALTHGGIDDQVGRHEQRHNA